MLWAQTSYTVVVWLVVWNLDISHKTNFIFLESSADQLLGKYFRFLY